MLIDKIISSVKNLKLDLNGKIVLTEAASGPYVVTPIIAALSGAKVYAFSKTTKYGSFDEIKRDTIDLAKKLNVDSKIKVIDSLNKNIISKVDIVTNSGHLRPLNSNFLKYLKSNSVISLMYESWEFRESDLDLNFCKKNDIKVAAMNERHPDIDVFSYLGDMAIKMILDAGLCLNNNSFVLICNNDFGPYIAKTLSKNCKMLGVCDLKKNKHKYSNLKINWIGNFPNFSVNKNLSSCEAIIFTAYPFTKSWIGSKNNIIDVKKIEKEFKNPFILRFAGHIDEADLFSNKINFYPNKVSPGHMGIIPSEIGFDPIIRLQSGGLKVGQALIENKSLYNNVKIYDLL